MYKTLYRAQYRESDNAFKYKAPATPIHHTCSDNQPDRQTDRQHLKLFTSTGDASRTVAHFFPLILK